MRHFVWTLILTGVSTLLVACGGNNNNNAAVNGYCPAGSTLNPYGQCVNSLGQVISVNGINTNINLGYFADNWSNQRTISITDQSAFREFLRTAMGVCDRMTNTGGTANCSNWISGGFDVVMMIPNGNINQVNLVFRAWPRITNYGYYNYQAPGLSGFLASLFGIPTASGINSGGYYNPLSLTVDQSNSGSINSINNSAGFEVRTYGPLYSVGNRSLIQVRVENGKLGDGSFTFKLGYPNCVADNSKSCSGQEGKWFAQGTFSRCQSTNCSGGLW